MRSDSKNRIIVSSTARAPSAEASENAPDLASPCCASKKNSCFKENINVNKSGASSLSLEPQQMKKKKKGGKHNLRKSQAWDRAFFTDEGVLDPLELSAISDASCRGVLPFISEDTPASSGQGEDFHKDNRNDQSSPGHGLSSSHRITPNFLTSHNVPTSAGRKIGSNFSDCPRPLPSPSLKRRANANVAKATSKELKLPKVPGVKPGFSPTCATTRSAILRGSHVKHNQITQPDFSIHREVELKSSSKSRKNTESASKANTPQPVFRSNGNLGCSSVNRHLSINMSPMAVDKAYNSGPKTTPVNVTQSRPVNAYDSQQYDSATFSTSYSQNAHIDGENFHPSINQTMKPSGLRMPSPSLSFFSQPKPSVFRDLPLRVVDSYRIGSENPGSLRLQDKLRTTNLYDRIPDSRISSSKAICSRSESTASSHVSTTDLVKHNLERNPMYEVGLKVLSDVSSSHLIGDQIFEDSNNVFGQIQGPHKKKIIMRVSHEEAELQKIGIKVSSQNRSCEQAREKFLKNVTDDCLVKSESYGSEWRNAELGSKQSLALLESHTLGAIVERHEIENKCNILVLDHDNTQQTDGFDERVQNAPAIPSDWRKTSKLDCHKAHMEETNPPPTGNDKRNDKDISNDKERMSEQLNGPQQNGSYCCESMKALERREAMSESPYFVSKQLNDVKVLTDDLPAAEPCMQNRVSASTSDGCKNDVKIMSEVGNDINQLSESPEVQDIYKRVEMESKQIGNIRDRLLAEKQLSLQNLKQEENVDEYLLVVSDRKDGKKVIDSNIPLSISPGKTHKGNQDKEMAVAQALRTVECDSVAKSLSSESCNSPISAIFYSDASNLYGNLLDHPHQDTQSIEINDSSLSENTMCELSPEDALKKMEQVPHILFSSADNELASTMSLKNSESGIDNLKDLKDTQTLLVQSSESNMLNNGCFQQSECLSLAGDEFVEENLVHIDDCMEGKHLPDVFSAVNVVGGVKDSVTSQNDILQSVSRSSNSNPANEPLQYETCKDEYKTGGGIADETIDPSRVEPSSDSVKVEVSTVADNFLSRLPPELDHAMVETTFLPNNKHGDGLEEKKSISLVIPPNAIPFSDEWLAAMEAAGEDILTRKSGAVQNSPTDKPLPEPSPWSRPAQTERPAGPEPEPARQSTVKNRPGGQRFKTVTGTGNGGAGHGSMVCKTVTGG